MYSYIFHGHVIVHCVGRDPSETISLFSLLQPQGPVAKAISHCSVLGHLGEILEGQMKGRDF